MTFWNFNNSDKAAVVTPEKSYSYKQLNKDIQDTEILIQGDTKELVLILCENKYEVIVSYLAVLRTNHVAMLISADTDEALLSQIVDTYKPLWVYTTLELTGYKPADRGNFRKRIIDKRVSIHPDLAIMLSTSGTTGSQKFVRLSYKNIQSNADSIVEYLQMNDSERGIANLPISYSYGLSIINSHFAAEATLLLTNESVISKSFWSFVKEQEATSFPGVPFTYQILQRVGFLKMNLPHLRYFTQAGGRLGEDLIQTYAAYALEHNKRFYVMYGQTEASPRISYIPPGNLLNKIGKIGIAVPNGELDVDPDTSELIYKGPNVMMGYAITLADLEKTDEHNGVLRTGDIASIDEDGYFSIIGRLKRFVKLFGLRINLDEIEKFMESKLHIITACTGEDDRMLVVIESAYKEEGIREALRSTFKLHHSSYQIKVVESIPRFENGKINYNEIKGWL